MKLLPGLAALALATPLVLSGQAAAADPTTACPQHPLTTLPDRTNWHLSSTSPDGRYQVGTAQDANGVDQVVRWTDGVPAVLTAKAAWWLDVNNEGDVAGSGDGTNWVYRDGRFHNLPTPAGYTNARVVAISNYYRGEVVGTVTDAEGWNRRPVVWDAVTNQPRVFPTASGFNETTVNDIDDNGTVVGSVVDFDIDNANTKAQKGAYWSVDGTVNVLPGSSAASFGEVQAVRHGRAAGTDAGKVVVWRLTANAPGTPIATRGPVAAINGRGSVVYGSGLAYIHRPGKDERQLAMQDPGGALGIGVAGLTENDQAYGGDGMSEVPVRWDCS